MFRVKLNNPQMGTETGFGNPGCSKNNSAELN